MSGLHSAGSGAGSDAGQRQSEKISGHNIRAQQKKAHSTRVGEGLTSNFCRTEENFFLPFGLAGFEAEPPDHCSEPGPSAGGKKKDEK